MRYLLGVGVLLLTTIAAVEAGAANQDLQEQNKALLERLQSVHALSEQQMQGVRKVFAGSPYIGQGNPAITRHPLTKEQCRDKLGAAQVEYDNPEFERICGAKYMSPLYDPEHQSASEAKACIDQFEFPDIPCEYPVVWVRAKEAAEICSAMGKRLCDAHEWEGGCAGQLLPPDYGFSSVQGMSSSDAIHRMRSVHNKAFSGSKSWSYGSEYRKGVCAADSVKSSGCTGGSWSECGSNTYPAGSFPECRSSKGVYDINGNAAEHMNLPLREEEMASRGSSSLGYTEMKGSWFIFDSYRAHEDWCRWRAPFWHGTKVMDKDSHHNYHLGFRCCKSL